MYPMSCRSMEWDTVSNALDRSKATATVRLGASFGSSPTRFDQKSREGLSSYCVDFENRVGGWPAQGDRVRREAIMLQVF